MKKSLRILSILCVVVIAFLALSTFAFSAKKEMVEEWIGADGGEITLEGRVTITFDSGVLTKDTKIFIIYFGDGLYQFGSEVKVKDDTTFTVCFVSPPEEVETFKQGEWVEIDSYNGSGCFETNHFSRYRGAW